MQAKFWAEEVYVLKGRGVVIVGRIYEGIFRIGMHVSIPGVEGLQTITGVEMIKRVDGEHGYLGLFFPILDPQETKHWQSLNLQDIILEIQESE